MNVFDQELVRLTKKNRSISNFLGELDFLHPMGEKVKDKHYVRTDS
jgi:hypothetical protein